MANRVVRHWSIVVRENGMIEVEYNDEGRIGTGKQEESESLHLYRGRDINEALRIITDSAFGV